MKEMQARAYEYLVGLHGGEAVVMLEVFAKEIATLAKKGGTVGDLLDLAAEGGWTDSLRQMKLVTLVEAIRLPGTGPAAAQGKRGRITPEGKTAVHKRLVEFVTKHPWSTSREIASGVGDVANLGTRLKELREGGLLKAEGVKAQMRYALKGEKTKPAKG